MVFITGDTHYGKEMFDKFKTSSFPEQKNLTKDDTVIVLGDFGAITWDNSKETLYNREWLADKPFQTVFVDGNHCLTKDTEVLTSEGFVNIVDCFNNNYKIANFDISSKQIKYDYPIHKVKSFKEKQVIFSSNNIHHSVSLDHDIIINNKKIKAIEAVKLNLRESNFTLVGNSVNNIINLSTQWLRLLTNVVMDATIVDYSKYNKMSKKLRIQWHLVKQRKINHLISLLDDLNIKFTIRRDKVKHNAIFINVYSDYARYIYKLLRYKKKLPDSWKNLNKEQLLVVLDEIRITDGDSTKTNYISWFSTSTDDINVIQIACLNNGIISNFKKVRRSGYNSKNKKQLYIFKAYPKKKVDYYVDVTIKDYNDYMYCFTMPLGTLVVRNNGKITFTGNCNFDYLNSLPTKVWNCGKVGIIETKNGEIYHLRRGEIYTIDGKTFLAIGGATSTDKEHRLPNVSWWKEEELSKADEDNVLNNLDKVGWKVDYVITHTCPQWIGNDIYSRYHYPCSVQTFLNFVENRLDYKHWFFGHYHYDLEGVRKDFTCLYHNIKQLGD